jgi:hypothetical protein
MIREVDTRDATFIRGEPERQDKITAVAQQVSNGPGMQRLAVARLNPATATVAELRCSGGSPSAEERRILAQRYVQATRLRTSSTSCPIRSCSTRAPGPRSCSSVRCIEVFPSSR